jgi:hypothetical protein
MTARQFVLAVAAIVSLGGTGSSGVEPLTSTQRAGVLSGGITAEDPNDLGHFTLGNGAGGLAGVRAQGTFNFTMGQGGKYVGFAHFERRVK